MITALLWVAFAASAVTWLVTLNRTWAVPVLVFTGLLIAKHFDAGFYTYATIVTLGLLALIFAVRRYRHPNTSVKPFIVSGLMVFAAWLVVSLLPLGNPFNNGDPSATGASKDAVQALTVVNPTSACPVAGFNIPAQSSKLNGRARLDAVSTPFVAVKPAAMVVELKKTVCVDPLFGAMVMNGFANDPNILKANPWLEPFKGTQETSVNAAVAPYMNHRNREHPTATDKQEMKDLEAQWRIWANMTNTMLSSFKNPERLPGIPTRSYHLLGSADKYWGLPGVGLNTKQQAQTALRLTLIPEGGHCEMVIAFDAQTKNMAWYPCATR